MIGYGLDRGGPKDSETAPNSFLTKINGNVFWRFVPDMENHTTTSSQHEIEVGQVKLTERKETTTVTDDNQVNLGKTVIKHIRTIEEPLGMEQEETAPALRLLCCQKERHSQESTDDSQLSLISFNTLTYF